MDVFDRFTAKASDPVIEPMLQLVPDPFDSYGPPQAEDQIFSILPPLSIMSNTPSSAPSPLSQTPERDGFQQLPAVAGPTAPSWIPSSIAFPSDDTSDLASSPSSSSTRTPTSSPPRSLSPSAPVPHRHSTFPAGVSGHHPRKSDSKLRSVLSVIDESQTPQHQRPREGSGSGSGLPISRSASAPVIQNGDASCHTPLDEQISSPVNGDDESTPRHSMAFDSESPTEQVAQKVVRVPDDAINIPLPT
ncbi:hypothetical protein HGRIS_009616 [Hohenbuehelia grisea]|uniref:Uncharacterized protein n=1 Tax=Hohenbuehelia grisea TaxID=104357 RepID=A0ABR3J1Q3_9AGAR